jgi:benzoyl-CoA reductase/2-hydroxyglutaryl-CoA dehydratase subunit BcrC/BadD/HgdB
MIADAREAKAAGKPIAYSFIHVLYYEIIRAMDLQPVWVENYAGVCAAKHEAERFLNQAEIEGFSRSTCTYATCLLGFDALRGPDGESPADAPWGGVPPPDMMLGAGQHICDPRYKWFQAAQKFYDAPVYVHNIPWPTWGMDLKAVTPQFVRHIVEQLQGLIAFIERQTGRPMDYERLGSLVDLTGETFKTWWEAYQFRRAIPTPMGTEDAFNVMVPGYFLMATPEALSFYQDLHRELKEKVARGEGIVPQEKHRVLWGGGLAPWFALKDFDYFKSKGVVFPVEVSYRPFEPDDWLGVPRSATHPLERLAWRYLKYWTSRFEKAARRPGSHPDVELLIDCIEDYQVDGILMHEAFSCRTWHVGLLWQLNRLKRIYRDIPALVLESDIVDMRSYSETDTRMRIDAFVETLEARKRAG